MYDKKIMALCVCVVALIKNRTFDSVVFPHSKTPFGNISYQQAREVAGWFGVHLCNNYHPCDTKGLSLTMCAAVPIKLCFGSVSFLHARVTQEI
jgi:hypothetical protein